MFKVIDIVIKGRDVNWGGEGETKGGDVAGGM